jgi:hypothetical protein
MQAVERLTRRARRPIVAIATTKTNVAQLCEEATAAAEDAASFFAGLTAAQAATKTENGWTVAATAWHLGFGAALTVAQVKEVKAGKVRRAPRRVVDMINAVKIPSSLSWYALPTRPAPSAAPEHLR